MFFDTSGLNDGELCLQLIRTTEAQPEKGYVPAYHFHIRRCCDQVVLGECALRVGHNQNTYYGGNIGYGIYEPYRGHHYAGKACLLLLDLAKRHSMDHLIITCAPDNEASRKTCLFCGGKLLQIVDVPEWHEMYQTGRRKTCQYEIVL